MFVGITASRLSPQPVTFASPTELSMPTSARDLKIADYTYELPDNRIARHPAPVRDEARQLVYRNGEISEGVFRDLADRLPTGTLLIGNRTRVLHARLHFPLTEGKRPIEIFCLDPLEPVDYAQNLGARTAVMWKCLVGGNRRWKRGPLELETNVSGHPVTLTAEREERVDNAFVIRFAWTGGPADLTFGEVLSAAGNIPLPPYLGRASEAADHDRYQTVFAREEGSVAAPTAGLHFTPAVLDALAKKGIDWEEVTLHVGAGTFKPVDTPTLGDHLMHREYFTVSQKFIARVIEQIRNKLPIVCVGTTSLRCVESLFYIDTEPLAPQNISVGQWAAEEGKYPRENTLERLVDLYQKIKDADTETISGYTGIMLSPAAAIRIADGLITNFHQPNSTLLLLVAAFIGEDWRRVYNYALNNEFRFLSYGDSWLLWKRERELH